MPHQPKWRERTAPTLQGSLSNITGKSQGSTESILADIAYTSTSDVLAKIAEAAAQGRDSILITGVVPRTFCDIDRALQDGTHKTRVFFLRERKLLIVTIPTQAHELLHTSLFRGVDKQVTEMGLFDNWQGVAASRYPAKWSRGSTGEGDSGGRPVPERDDAHGWPTLVIQAGYTQSLPALRMKMHFWFTASGHDVKIVLLAKAFPDDVAQKRILVEHWQERQVPIDMVRPGATRTRRSAALSARTALQPLCLQTTTMVWALDGTPYSEASIEQQRNPQSFSVIRGPLQLDFECLFLRPPETPAEHDVVLSDDFLRLYAASVWRAVETTRGV